MTIGKRRTACGEQREMRHIEPEHGTPPSFCSHDEGKATMCQDDDDWDQDAWDAEWEQPSEETMNSPSQFGLIGVIFRPGQEPPWTVQDNRKALKNEYPCATKIDVLDKIASIIDDMHNPPAKLDQNSEPLDVAVAVTLRVSLCDLDNEVNILDLRRSVSEAVANAVHHHEQVGFDHALAEIVSLGVIEVRPLNTE